MLLANQELSSVCVIPALQVVGPYIGNNDCPTALTLQTITNHNKSPKSPAQEGIIQLGSIYNNQAFLTMGFPAKKQLD